MPLLLGRVVPQINQLLKLADALCLGQGRAEFARRWVVLGVFEGDAGEDFGGGVGVVVVDDFDQVVFDDALLFGERGRRWLP